MSKTHIGIHVLTAYPPSNPNRDENGQPKTAIVGGVKRQRISSQCVKRTWRLSEIMQELDTEFSTRTRGIGLIAEKAMIDGGLDEKLARTNASEIAAKFGSLNKKRLPENNEMVVLGAEEVLAVSELAKLLAKDKRKPTEVELEALQQRSTSMDVALFGRMRASSTVFNMDASVYVSHPLTTNKATIDSDFWTSVDDLKDLDETADGGAGGMGETEFGSGSYYTYVQVNLDGLTNNLGGDRPLATRSIAKLIEAIATTSPSGHKATFGNVVRASYLRVEVGQPSGNMFSKAFEKPVETTEDAIDTLTQCIKAEQDAYGIKSQVFEFSTVGRTGSLAATIQGVAAALESA